MVFTKEKILAAIAIVVAAVTLVSAHVPEIEPLPTVPAEESARPYRAVTAAPQLSPEDALDLARDPFTTKDPWQPATPALLVVPPPAPWPRALPGGPSALPQTPAERLQVKTLPGVKKS